MLNEPMSNMVNATSRARVAIGLLVVVALSVSVTWVVAGRIKSPAEAAARTEAPEPSPILVPVETRVLGVDIVTRGTGRFGSPQLLAVAASDLRISPRYVDTTPAIGAEIDEGQVALVASGRPVIVLAGEQPAYRDMGPGMSGGDIQQLEEALDRLGFAPGIVDGVFDADTEEAVREWYEALGYTPVTTTTAQIETIRTIEADIQANERDLLATQEAVTAAQGDVTAAQGALRSATTAVEQSDATAATAQTEADAATAAAEAEAHISALAAEQAWIQLPPEWASVEEDQAALFELENLRAAAAAARANVDQVRAMGTAAVTTALADTQTARADEANASAAVWAATDRLDVAVQAAELAASPRQRLDDDLASSQAQVGVQVPADEIIFVPDVPIRVAEVHVARGSLVEGPLLSATDAVVAIDGALALDQVAVVEPGMAAKVTEPDLGIDADAIVSFVAAGPGTRGTDGFHVYFELVVTDSTTPITNIAGSSVRLALSVESSDGPVLAVPASAVTLAVDGTSKVQVDRNGTIESVSVEPGLAASGYVAITPVDAELAEGELVVIGFEQRVTTDG